MSRLRFWIAVTALLLLSAPMRLVQMGQSVWLDEAWVVNSVLEPTSGEMFHYKDWVQSSPPLFLVLMRAAMSVTGSAEWQARIVPWIATVLAPFILAGALRRPFGPAAALVGAAFMISNYWSIKYAQQAKQYGTDMLAAAIGVWLVTRWSEESDAGRPSRWLPALTGCFAATAIWLSFQAAFFLPVLLWLMVRRRWRVAIPVMVLAGVSAAANYVVAVQPARTPWMIRNWKPMMLNPDDFMGSLARVGNNFASLTIPQIFPGAGFVAAGIALVAVGGLIASSGQRRHLLLLAGVAPILPAIAAGFLGMYPVAGQVRAIVWTLPCLAVLVAGAAVWLLRWAPPKTAASLGVVFGLCAVTVLAGQWTLSRVPQHHEQNREAIKSIRAEFDADHDCLFVHGGMAQAFKYYSARLGWVPPCRFTGTINVPCCPSRWPKDNGSPGLFFDELKAIRSRIDGKRLWMFLPGNVPGHWGRFFRTTLAEIPARMAENGCTLEWERGFDETKAQRYRCSP